MPAAAPLTADSLPLRDIHLPPAISWWPPAPGWWLLLLLTVLSVGVFVYWLRRRQRRRYRRLALAQLRTLQEQYQPGEEQALLQAVSRLLRQSAQLHYPAAACAGLVGQNWLEFLDQQIGGAQFAQGCGQVLALGPYLPAAPEVDASALFALCRRWLGNLPLAPQPLRRQQ